MSEYTRFCMAFHAMVVLHQCGLLSRDQRSKFQSRLLQSGLSLDVKKVFVRRLSECGMRLFSFQDE